MPDYLYVLGLIRVQELLLVPGSRESSSSSSSVIMLGVETFPVQYNIQYSVQYSLHHSDDTMKASSSTTSPTVVLGSALCGAALYAAFQRIILSRSKTKLADPETDFSIAHDTVWAGIGGALKASHLYIGDRLQLYSTLREACAKPGSSVTAIELAELTGYHQRWLREWLAQQAAMQVLTLLPGTGNDDDADLHYRLPWATGEVLANPDSPEYDISLISCVPSLVNRAKTMLPEAFSTGIGRPYDEPEVANGIDRHHRIEIRDLFMPKILPSANNGAAEAAMKKGCRVADLGCGAGNLVLAMAKAYPNSKIDGFEISHQALSIGATNLVKSKLKNAFLIDANDDPLGNHMHEYDVITTFDVLHDAPNPAELIRQVKSALKPGGVWLLGDIAGKASMRENITDNVAAATQFAFSTCLCMACSLSTLDGAGLGTLGFNIPVAEKMIREGGFETIKVILESKKNTRWFEIK